MGLSDLKRVTDLFVEGELLVIEESDPPTTLWVNKLNSFEREECQREGQAARARMILAMKELQSPEYLTFQGNLAEMDDDAIREAMADTRSTEFFLAAVDGIRQDPEWADRMEARNRVSDDMSAEETAAVVKVNDDYSEELSRRIDFRRAGYIAELENEFETTRLKEAYRKAWLESRAFTAFQREYAKWNLYFAVRVCKAKQDADERWQHIDCDGHRQRALDSASEVPTLPDWLLERLQLAMQQVQVSGRDARFSGALASSSGSSAPQSAPEVSTLSTPEEMSSGPVSISSSPSVRR